MTDEALELALSIRIAVADRPPEGFSFQEHVVRQDEGLARLIDQLKSHDGAVVGPALEKLIAEEQDGWTLLKLLELAERLELPQVAPALLQVVQSPPEQGDRRRFLAGRACEVMLKLPLAYDERMRANELCQAPLADLARFRLGAERERALHRPRRIEWLLLVVLMALGLGAFVFAWMALGS